MILDEAFICRLCGHSSTQAVIASTNKFGHSDFDLRPPEMARSTIYHQIQTCPKCKYCAGNISADCPSEFSKKIIRQDYLDLYNNPEIPEKARQFLCSSMLLASIENKVDAGWGALRAAWICDDKKLTEQAVHCREEALAHFEHARKNQQHFLEDEYAEDLILTDLYRRCGNMAQATETAWACLKRNPSPRLVDILRRELELILDNDQSCHNLKEIA